MPVARRLHVSAVWLKTMFFIESARFLRIDAFICKLSMVGGRLPKRNGNLTHPNGNLSQPFDRHLGNGSFSGKRRFAQSQRNMPLRRTANKWTLQKSQATRANFPDPNSTCKALQCQPITTRGPGIRIRGFTEHIVQSPGRGVRQVPRSCPA